MHRLAKIFSSMRSNKNHPTVAYPIQFRMMVIRNYCMLHGVNHGIPRHINGCCIFSFVQQMLFCQFSGSKIILTDNSDCLTIEFFWIRAVNIVGTQTGLHMSDRNLQIEASQCCYKGRRGITMNQNDIRFHIL